MPSLRKSGKTWRKGKLHQRGQPASLALGHECGQAPGWHQHLAQSFWAGRAPAAWVRDGAELGPVVPCLVPGQVGAACAAGTGWGPACSRKVIGSQAEKALKRQTSDQISCRRNPVQSLLDAETAGQELRNGSELAQREAEAGPAGPFALLLDLGL